MLHATAAHLAKELTTEQICALQRSDHQVFGVVTVDKVFHPKDDLPLPEGEEVRGYTREQLGEILGSDIDTARSCQVAGHFPGNDGMYLLKKSSLDRLGAERLKTLIELTSMGEVRDENGKHTLVIQLPGLEPVTTEHHLHHHHSSANGSGHPFPALLRDYLDDNGLPYDDLASALSLQSKYDLNLTTSPAHALHHYPYGITPRKPVIHTITADYDKMVDVANRLVDDGSKLLNPRHALENKFRHLVSHLQDGRYDRHH